MSFQFKSLCLLVLIVTSTLLFTSQSVSGQDAMSPIWKNGLGFSTADGKNKISLGGRLQIDTGFFSEEDGVDVEEDGVRMRRGRIALSGLINGNIEFKTQYDFTGGDADFKDFYMGFLNKGSMPDMISKIRVGQQYEPFGLETLISSKYITFAERSFTDVFSPSRNTGILAFMDPFENMDSSFALGVFKDDNGYGNAQGDNEQAVTGRLTLAPINEKDGTILHLGVGFSSRKNPGATISYDANALSSLGEDIVTGSLASEQVDLLGFEAAYSQGPLSLQAEMVQSSLDTADATAWYLMASYFLTGESRPYKASSGVFSRIKPANNQDDAGSGALELAVRITEIDLEEMTAGEEAEAVTVGLNWYLNPNSRIMFNLTNASPGEASAYGNDVTSFVTRFAVNF